MAAVSAEGSTVWVLIRRLNSPCRRFNCIRCADRFPLTFREPREGKQLVARFLQAIGDGAAFHPPFADERLALRLDLPLRAGVDHIVVIGGNFFMQPVRRMSEKIAMFMHRTAWDRHVAPERGKSFLEAGRAIDNDKLRHLQG